MVIGDGLGLATEAHLSWPWVAVRVVQVMKIMPVQKQTSAGQRTRFKAFVAIGDYDGHVGLGVKCAKEVATAIRGTSQHSFLSLTEHNRELCLSCLYGF